MDGVKHGRSSSRTTARTDAGRMFRVQRECMYPKAVKDVSQVKFAIVQREEKWKNIMAEFGGGVRIPDLRRMLALMEICPNEVKEQMLMRLDDWRRL